MGILKDTLVNISQIKKFKNFDIISIFRNVPEVVEFQRANWVWEWGSEWDSRNSGAFPIGAAILSLEGWGVAQVTSPTPGPAETSSAPVRVSVSLLSLVLFLYHGLIKLRKKIFY